MPNPFHQKLKLEHKQVMWELKIFGNEKTEASEKFKELTKETCSWASFLLFVDHITCQIQLEHKQVMWELKIFGNEKTEASEKFKELTKETVFYRGLHSRLLMEKNLLKRKVDMLKQENKKVQEEWVLLKHHLDDLNLVCTNQEENSDLKIQQQQELKRLEERLEVLLKQKEMVIQIKELSEKLQHHFDVSQMRGLHSRLLMEKNLLKRKVDMLKQENKKVQEEWVLLKHHLDDLNLVCTNQEENSDLKIQQQQELKRLEERLEVLLKQKEMVIQIKELSEKLQHHFDVSQMRSTQLQPELEQETTQDESHLQKELLHQEPPAECYHHQVLNS
ncbi:E330034G19Rik [Phodopus roborovskii]|uniref:E330034G19Rik protein n=1 Tax=Phodopus roborovskii TaxID=109678 RepID=A0AAV0AE71_PHORO|nr:E330034G19Rik [Phodopus roborovskii]